MQDQYVYTVTQIVLQQFSSPVCRTVINDNYFLVFNRGSGDGLQYSANGGLLVIAGDNDRECVFHFFQFSVVCDQTTVEKLFCISA